MTGTSCLTATSLSAMTLLTSYSIERMRSGLSNWTLKDWNSSRTLDADLRSLEI